MKSPSSQGILKVSNQCSGNSWPLACSTTQEGIESFCWPASSTDVTGEDCPSGMIPAKYRSSLWIPLGYSGLLSFSSLPASALGPLWLCDTACLKLACHRLFDQHAPHHQHHRHLVVQLWEGLSRPRTKFLTLDWSAHWSHFDLNTGICTLQRSGCTGHSHYYISDTNTTPALTFSYCSSHYHCPHRHYSFFPRKSLLLVLMQDIRFVPTRSICSILNLSYWPNSIGSFL